MPPGNAAVCSLHAVKFGDSLIATGLGLGQERFPEYRPHSVQRRKNAFANAVVLTDLCPGYFPPSFASESPHVSRPQSVVKLILC